MLALVPLRDGVAPLGTHETIEECSGRVLFADLGPFQPHRWAAALAPAVEHAPIVVLPASPDGRDLAPHLAHRLGRPLLAGAVVVSSGSASLACDGGTALHDVTITEAVVATLQPGLRSPHHVFQPATEQRIVTAADVEVPADAAVAEPVLEAVLAPDVETMDLSEAPRIVGGGAGLDGAPRLRQLHDVAAALGAAMGVTRVITDRGWVDHQRQIGTTGVVVDPDLYLAFGISGAVQHTAGLGDPRHVVSINLDPHCPMMHLADLAIVADANEVIDHLAWLLGTAPGHA